MVNATLNWLGPTVLSAVRIAEEKGLTEAAADASLQARQLIVEQNIIDTGHMLNTTEFKPATRRGARVEASFGNYSADYAIWHEIGTTRMRARPWLRPALEIVAPSIPRRIGSYLR